MTKNIVYFPYPPAMDLLLSIGSDISLLVAWLRIFLVPLVLTCFLCLMSLYATLAISFPIVVGDAVCPCVRANMGTAAISSDKRTSSDMTYSQGGGRWVGALGVEDERGRCMKGVGRDYCAGWRSG